MAGLRATILASFSSFTSPSADVAKVGKGKEAAKVVAVVVVSGLGGAPRWSMPSKATAAASKTFLFKIASKRRHTTAGAAVASTWRWEPGRKSRALAYSQAVGPWLSGWAWWRGCRRPMVRPAACKTMVSSGRVSWANFVL